MRRLVESDMEPRLLARHAKTPRGTVTFYGAKRLRPRRSLADLLAQALARCSLAGSAHLHGNAAVHGERRSEALGLLLTGGVDDHDYGVLGLVHPVCQQLDAHRPRIVWRYM